MMTEDRTAAARLPEHMASRTEYVAELFARMATEDPGESYRRFGDNTDPHDEMAEMALAVDTFRTVKVTLSTGGPADGLIFHINSDGEAYDVRYWFADWFDYAETVVPEGSPLLDYAADIAEMVHQSEDR